MNRKNLPAYVMFMALILFFGCEMGFDEYANGMASKDTVLVSLAIQTGETASRSVLPQVSLEGISSYELRGGKVGSAESVLHSFTEEKDAQATLEPGRWNFTLNAYKEDTIYLRGILMDQSISGPASSLTFVMTPPFAAEDGSGSIEMRIGLPPDSGVDSAEIFVDGESRHTLETGGAQTLYFDEDKIPSGDYFISVKLKDAKGAVLRVVSELVQIRSGLVSAKTITLTTEDLNAPTSVTPAQYTVTFDAQGGSPEPPAMTVDVGTALGSLPAAPSRDGYTFGGWWTGIGGTGTLYTASSPGVTENITLYAHWIAVASLAVPQNFHAESTPVGILLTWDAVSGAEGYTIYRAGQENANYLASEFHYDVPAGSNPSYLDTDIPEGDYGTTWYYKVRAYKDGGVVTSELSAVASVVVPELAPQLAYDTIRYGSLSAGQTLYYCFEVTPGYYTVRWEDSGINYGQEYADIKVGVKYWNADYLVPVQDTPNPCSFYADHAGYVVVEVQEYGYSSGLFGVAYKKD
jgi:uncharacterized repeat protein (TIGR02543 family)